MKKRGSTLKEAKESRTERDGGSLDFCGQKHHLRGWEKRQPSPFKKKEKKEGKKGKGAILLFLLDWIRRKALGKFQSCQPRRGGREEMP